jgi:tRNA A37 methylthiotransferase MiaB
MPGQVPVEVARERNRILREVGERKRLAFMQGFVGKTLEAITLAANRQHVPEIIPEQRPIGLFTEALTDNYLKLRLQGRHKPNLWIRARVRQVEDQTLIATPV